MAKKKSVKKKVFKGRKPSNKSKASKVKKLLKSFGKKKRKR
ncbi:MAG: hypothetical protein QME12_05885 [Nanoarchaeota archaeon]|nr:hypothetical protein [Nanoarchaeota archaeon]